MQLDIYEPEGLSTSRNKFAEKHRKQNSSAFKALKRGIDLESPQKNFSQRVTEGNMDFEDTKFSLEDKDLFKITTTALTQEESKIPKILVDEETDTINLSTQDLANVNPILRQLDE